MSVAAVVMLAALQAPAQFAVVAEADTSWVPAGEVIEVPLEADVSLPSVVFDAGGGVVETDAAWWHSGDNPVFELDTDGAFAPLAPGEDRVMFHWNVRDPDSDAVRGDMVWVTIRVVAATATEGP